MVGILRLVMVIMCVSATVALSGCGGGGGSSDPQQDVALPLPDASTIPITSYVGKWNGAYTLSGKTASTPVTINLAAGAVKNSLSGTVYSEFISGEATGVLGSNGKVVLSVNNLLDSSVWDLTLSITSGGLAIDSIVQPTVGSASIGTGSCTLQSAASIDLSGEYPVKIRQTYPGNPGPYFNATMLIAKASDTSYVGAIIGDGGLQSQIKFFKSAGYWFMQIPSAKGTLGSNIIATDGLLSQSAIIEDSQLTTSVTDGVVSPAIAPLSATMTGTYPWDFNNQTYSMTVNYEFSVYFEGLP